MFPKVFTKTYKPIAATAAALAIAFVSFTPSNAQASNKPPHLDDRTASTEYRAAFSSAAEDWKGMEPSLYRGKHHTPQLKDFRTCVMYQESRYNYRAANKTSSARGAYQFLDRAWRVSLTFMLMPEARDHGLQQEVKNLREQPIDKWSRYWQDAAFYTVMSHPGAWKHWYIPGGRCNDLGSRHRP